MDQVDKDLEGPEMPVFFAIAKTFRAISLFIFVAGIVSLVVTFSTQESLPQEMSLMEALRPGFFLLICGVLAVPCIYGLKNASENSARYFSKDKTLKKKGFFTTYYPESITIHLVMCCLLASSFFNSISNTEDGVLGFVFGLVYVMATISFVLLMYFKKHVTV